ncbi:MAG: hypothetical protein A2046_16905 [Bacteroidetes bacterium GWA2_30_7]|nr:MAG: hypothetical protein A2046_16905 [Bacteroidetes bacterium GWA2_30_7]
MNLIEKVKKTRLWIFLLWSAQLWAILKLFNEIFQIITDNNMENYKTISEVVSQFDWFNFITQTIIVIILYLMLKKYDIIKKETNEKMIIFSIIMYQKSKDIMMPILKDDKAFIDNIISEYYKSRNIVQNNFKDKSLNEIDKLMIEYYPNEVRKIIIK